MHNKILTDEFIAKYKDLPTDMGQLGTFVYYRTYSRFLRDENRREKWYETVRRAVEYNCSLDKTITRQEAETLYDNMFHLRQFLSGRTMWVGGTEVAEKFPMSNFNCAFQVIDNVKSFSQLLYLLLLGSGVGVRILKDDVGKLPLFRTDIEVRHKNYQHYHSDREDTTFFKVGDVGVIDVGDSKNGWVDAIKHYFSILTKGKYTEIKSVVIIYDRVRPMGSPLKTFGGTASGHDALKTMFVKIDNLLKSYNPKDCGKSYIALKPIDCLDIVNIIGEGVVVGGVRRTAEITLFDSDDVECIQAKDNLYIEENGAWKPNLDILHRQMSNNSIYYKEKPTREQIHWQLEKMRYSGEPAWVNEVAGAKRRNNMNGVNPCGEILLDSKGMCNLTTLNLMAFVNKYGRINFDELYKAQRLSARASFRMTLVDLELKDWNEIQHRDRLVGCSLTGWQDMVNAVGMQVAEQKILLQQLRKVAKDEVEQYAKSLGLNAPLLVTTIKPEGTISQLPTVSSGVHYSHSPYYVRRIRINSSDPLVKVCEELGYPIYAEVGQTLEDCKTKVVEFPIKAPNGVTKYDVSAIQQLENYKMFMENYVEHNCSITVHVRDNEWDEVEQWVWDNWDDVVAVSFIPLSDSFYQLMPYEAITEEEYLDRVAKMKPFDISLLAKYEKHEQQLDVGNDGCENGICPIR